MEGSSFLCSEKTSRRLTQEITLNLKFEWLSQFQTPTSTGHRERPWEYGGTAKKMPSTSLQKRLTPIDYQLPRMDYGDGRKDSKNSGDLRDLDPIFHKTPVNGCMIQEITLKLQSGCRSEFQTPVSTGYGQRPWECGGTAKKMPSASPQDLLWMVTSPVKTAISLQITLNALNSTQMWTVQMEKKLGSKFP